jgi:hypothetical protein
MKAVRTGPRPPLHVGDAALEHEPSYVALSHPELLAKMSAGWLFTPPIGASRHPTGQRRRSSCARAEGPGSSVDPLRQLNPAKVQEAWGGQGPIGGVIGRCSVLASSDAEEPDAPAEAMDPSTEPPVGLGYLDPLGRVAGEAVGTEFPVGVSHREQARVAGRERAPAPRAMPLLVHNHSGACSRVRTLG